MVRKLGPIGNLLGMLPGAAQNREALSQVSDKDLDRAAAIVNSMTVEERRNPKIINGSRRARIAGGSGVTVGEVNQLIVRFQEGQKMMRQMMGSMPGMGGHAAAEQGQGQDEEEGQGRRPAGGRRPGRQQSARQAAGAAGRPRSGRGQAGRAVRRPGGACRASARCPASAATARFKLPGSRAVSGPAAESAAGLPRPAGQEGP